ncbi:MAG: undecaprenyl diphosphate synthase family protein [Archaeoglobaceae archaeon]
MLMKIYIRKLEREIKKVPEHLMIVSDSFSEEKFEQFVEWCRRFGIREITLCLRGEAEVEARNFKLRIVKDGVVKEVGEGSVTVNLIAGFDGRKEITNAIKKLAEDVLNGRIDPEAVDERTLEKYLAVRSQPDMILKVGNDLPEFLIWQSIYSELYFADTDWKHFRYVDFLRMLRDYQRRERRYGR